MIVIGIDPGTANNGFGVIRVSGGRMVALDGGVIETDANARVDGTLPAKLLADPLHTESAHLRAPGFVAQEIVDRLGERLGIVTSRV